MTIPPELLAPACASPPDVLARLVVADWLEENGEDGSGWRWLAETGREPSQKDPARQWFAHVFAPPHYQSYARDFPRSVVPLLLLKALRVMADGERVTAHALRRVPKWGFTWQDPVEAVVDLATAWVALGPELQAEARKEALPR